MEAVTDSLTETIAALVAKFAPPETRNVALTPTTHLVDELGIDSSRMVDIVLDTEDAFQIRIDDEEIDNTRTFGELVELVRSKAAPNGKTS